MAHPSSGDPAAASGPTARQIDRPRVVSVMRTVCVKDALGPVPAALPETADLEQILAHVAEHGHEAIPVLGEDGALVGVLTAADVEAHAMTVDAQETSAGELAHAPRALAARP